MSELRYKESLSALAKALKKLEEALSQPITNPLLIDGVIQRFEFCIELSWKTLKKILEEEKANDINTPKSVFSKAYQYGWLDDESLWLKMLNDRNLTSHTYKEELAQEIFDRIKLYYPAMQNFYQFLNKKFNP